MSFYLTVNGIPVPQGSKRHVGRGVLIESSKDLKPWRRKVTAEATAALLLQDDDWEPNYKGPVDAYLRFCLPKPMTVPKHRRGWPIVRPDLDKLTRAIFDALTDAGVWGDDSQVVGVYASKEYELPRVEIRLEEREGNGDY